MNSDFSDELLEKLILDGIVEFAGLDKNGEMLYSFSPDIETKAPGIFEVMMDFRMRDVRQLWALGFLDMDIAEINPLVRLTSKAFNKEELAKLDKDLRISLEEIKRHMEQKSE